MLKTIQKYLYYALFFITPFVMYSGTSELFEFNKIIFIYFMTSCIVLIWGLRMLNERRTIFAKTPLDLPIILFVIANIFSTVFSIDQHTSLFGYYGRFNGGLISLFVYVILYYSFISFTDHIGELKQIIRKLFATTIISSSLVVLWGIPGRFGHDLSCLVFSGRFDNACWTNQFDPAARMFSTLGQPNWFGAYLAIVFFIGLFYFLKSRNRYWGIYLFLVLIGVFFSNSRSALFSVIIAGSVAILFFLLFIRSLKLPDLKKKIALGVVASVILLLIFKTGFSSIDKYLSFAFLQQKQTSPALSQKVNVAATAPTNITDSLDIRKIVWKGAIKLGMDYPLFGTGVETFAYAYYFVRPQEHNLTSEWDFLYNKAHNEYLNYFATTGFFGILTYLFFLLSVLGISIQAMRKCTDNSDKLLIALLISSWLTILITNFIGFSTTVINLYFYFIPLFILVIGNKITFPTLSKQAQKHKGDNYVSHIVLVAIFLFIVQYIASYWLADTKFAMAEVIAKTNDYQTATTLLQRALELHYEHTYEDKLSYYLANLAFVASFQKDTKSALSLQKAAEIYNEHTLQASPQNILYWKTKVKNLYIFYQISLNKDYLVTGIKALSQAQSISPTDPKIPYFQAMYYSMLYDESKDLKSRREYEDLSLVSIDQSITLKKDYFDSYLLKGQLLKKYNKKTEAKAVFTQILKDVSPGNKQVESELESL
ncbi:hypothetical protein COY90_04180 [Candidatus Roizmanbacteria bacterium CG_4_10_14_0_8_um_filter_39_9]|uniref:O-antigen ligase-related domain-containing protein n=1 Tax=Candidatus Roizmanbacteria bacterium CG_4_10_14_0_8_um_filter_39_9 TaxID=1974829 RepID=A0A2M7QD30_9BACT|nr:MAG: hypothetical protein COY90_04180 [Candidatus Roizmanbacteria bacterium CG_4_10_14_0_8_um_filter_39_9]